MKLCKQEFQTDIQPEFRNSSYSGEHGFTAGLPIYACWPNSSAGKVGISDNILFKPGPLTEEETFEIQHKPEISHHIALSAWPVLCKLDTKHHEWWNGKGLLRGRRKYLSVVCSLQR